MRAEQSVFVATVLGLGLALGAGLPLARADARPATIGVNEIHDGMKGYGLTVFKGTEPERFDVEVVGLLHNFRPGEDLILFKTPHPRLEVTKAVAGMSGSPIFLDGRLAGAYSYSLGSFPVETLAGATPIALMLAELARPIPPGFWPTEGHAPLPGKAPAARPRAEGGATSFGGAPGTYDLEAHAQELAARLGRGPDGPGAILPAETPLMLGGVGDRTAAYLRRLFEPMGLLPLQAGGGQAPRADAPLHYVDGGGLGVQLVSGDVSFMALGTVTHVEGTRLCAFGHPMMGAGNTALPTTIGRVLWVNASSQRSFKIGESARPLGALVNDRQTAIVVDEKVPAPTFPFDVKVVGADGAPKRQWHTVVADERFMSPSFTAAVLGSVVEATAAEERDMTWELRSRLSLRGHGTLELDDFGVAVGGMPEQGEWARSRIVHAVGDLLNNPWENTRVDKIEATLTVRYARELWRLRGIELMDEVVDAGQKARLRLHLVPFAGPELVKEIDVPMPLDVAGKEVELEALPGYEVAPEVAPPDTLDELLANESRQSALPRSVVVQFRLPAQGVAFRGHVAQDLPPFALDALRPAHSDQGPDAFASYQRVVVPLDRYLEGRDKVKVKVRAVVR